MGYFLQGYDYERHNEQVRRVWGAFHAGRPVRTPVILGINPRIFLLNPVLNAEGVTFEQYSNDPDLMVEMQLRSHHYVRHNMLQDAEMGLPVDGWWIQIDFQNYYDAGWFGAPIHYRDGQVPDTVPILGDDNKRMLFDRGVPDPFADGLMEKNWRFYEHIRANMSRYSYAGRPVAAVSPSGLGTDGPFTLACQLRGATQLCIDMYEAPGYFHELMSYLTEALATRIRAYRAALGHEPKPQSWSTADDSIELLSVEAYRQHVLPYHKKLFAELAGDGPHAMHLCGNVDRLIPVLKEELNVRTWDAGFPVEYGCMRETLGPDFQIQTGPRISTLLHGSPADVEAETRSILESGIAEGRFVLREANNLCPGTPVENVAAMYAAAGKYGMY